MLSVSDSSLAITSGDKELFAFAAIVECWVSITPEPVWIIPAVKLFVIT